MNISQIIQFIYPEAISDVDYRVEDNGTGQKITMWNLVDPQPTQAELEAAWPATQVMLEKNKLIQHLSNTDEGFVRVLEDLMDTLITKGTFVLTDLPQSAQNKINERKTLRDQLS